MRLMCVTWPSSSDPTPKASQITKMRGLPLIMANPGCRQLIMHYPWWPQRPKHNRYHHNLTTSAVNVPCLQPWTARSAPLGRGPKPIGVHLRLRRWIDRRLPRRPSSRVAYQPSGERRLYNASRHRWSRGGGYVGLVDWRQWLC